MFRWDDLQILLALHREGSVGSAAKTLGCNGSTISRRVAALEEDLGLHLFDRTPEGLRATETALGVMPLAEQAEAAALALERLAQGGDGEIHGVVRLAAPEDLTLHWLAPMMSELLSRHARLQVELVTGGKATDLNRHEADLAIRQTQPEGADLVSRKIATHSISGWAHRDYLAANSEVPWPQLDWVTWDGALAHRPEAKWIAVHVRKPPRLRVTSIVVGQAAVEAGLGVGLMSTTLGEANPDLVRVPDVPLIGVDNEIWLVAQRDVRRVPRVAAVWDWLVERILAASAPTATEPEWPEPPPDTAT